MTQRTFASWVVMITLIVLAVLQILLQLSFWGSIAGHDVNNAWLFQMIGSSLTIIEVFALVVAAELAEQGRAARARAFQAMFVVLACLNLTADLSAVEHYTSSSQREHARLSEAHQTAQTRETEIEVTLASLQRELQRAGYDRPADALRLERAALDERAERYRLSGARAPIRIVDDLAAMDSAIVVADNIVRVRAELAAARQARADASPAAIAVNFQALQRLAELVGVRASLDQVIATLAFVFALAVKVTLTIGFWAAAPHLSDFAFVAGRFKRQTLDSSTAAISPPPSAAPEQPAARQAATIFDRLRGAKDGSGVSNAVSDP